MLKQVFVGGHFSSGTRTVQFLMEQTHNVGATGEERDYEGGFSKRPFFSDLCLEGKAADWVFEHKLTGRDDSPIKKMPEEPFSVKVPDLMFCIPRLKEIFPESKFILVVRDGLDQINCANKLMMERYAGHFQLKEEGLKRGMEFWNKAYKKAIEDIPDLVVRLEDLVYNTKDTVQKIVDLTGIPYPDTSMIVKPKTMGAGTRDKETYLVGKEMMDYFGYGI